MVELALKAAFAKSPSPALPFECSRDGELKLRALVAESEEVT